MIPGGGKQFILRTPGSRKGAKDAKGRIGPKRTWTAVAERSDNTAFACPRSKSGVALRFSPQFKTATSCFHLCALCGFARAFLNRKEWIYRPLLRNCAPHESGNQTLARRRQPEHGPDGAGAQPDRGGSRAPARPAQKGPHSPRLAARSESRRRG